MFKKKAKKKKEEEPEEEAKTQTIEASNKEEVKETAEIKETRIAIRDFAQRYNGVFTLQDLGARAHSVIQLDLLFGIYAELRKSNALLKEILESDEE